MAYLIKLFINGSIDIKKDLTNIEWWCSGSISGLGPEGRGFDTRPLYSSISDSG